MTVTSLIFFGLGMLLGVICLLFRHCFYLISKLKQEIKEERSRRSDEDTVTRCLIQDKIKHLNLTVDMLKSFSPCKFTWEDKVAFFIRDHFSSVNEKQAIEAARAFFDGEVCRGCVTDMTVQKMYDICFSSPRKGIAVIAVTSSTFAYTLFETENKSDIIVHKLKIF